MLIEMTEEQFEAAYTLVENHLDPDAGWAIDDNPGCLFETYGAELAYVQMQNPAQVWTLVEGENNTTYLLSGFHLVNRIGYLVTQETVPEGQEIQIRVKKPDES